MSNAVLFKDLGFFLPELYLTLLILVVLIVDLFHRPAVSRRVGYWALAGLVLLLPLLWHQSSLPPRGLFYNMLAADGFALFFKWVATVATILVVWVSLQCKELEGRRLGEYFNLMLILLLGIFLLVGATHLMSIYLALEMVSLMSYVLAGYLKEKARSNEAAVKYVIYGAAASGMLLYGFSLLYGMTGTGWLHMIHQQLQMQVPNHLMLVLVATLVLVGFGYKIAAVPFHYWTPDVYEGAPTPITAYLSVAPKAAGFAVLIRFFNLAFTPAGNPNLLQWEVGTLPWPEILAVISLLTMTLGNVVALQQQNIKRMLAYSSIAHAGYMPMGVVVLNQMGISAVMYYAAVYMLMNLGAFFVAIYIQNRYGTETIGEYQGLGYKAPLVGVTMAIFMFALTGIPPTAGFVAKFYLFRALLGSGDKFFWLAIAGVLNGVISLYYYMRVLWAMYLVKTDLPSEYDHPPLSMGILLTILAIPLLVGWIFGDPLSTLANGALSFYLP